jgi:hypothetical protein
MVLAACHSSSTSGDDAEERRAGGLLHPTATMVAAMPRSIVCVIAERHETDAGREVVRQV